MCVIFFDVGCYLDWRSGVLWFVCDLWCGWWVEGDFVIVVVLFLVVICVLGCWWLGCWIVGDVVWIDVVIVVFKVLGWWCERCCLDLCFFVLCCGVCDGCMCVLFWCWILDGIVCLVYVVCSVIDDEDCVWNVLLFVCWWVFWVCFVYVWCVYGMIGVMMLLMGY